ncbi:MAG: acetate/propionate family kinase [Chlamydiota bacterium]
MDCIIVLNIGSSSLKFSFFSLEEKNLKRKYTGSVKNLGDTPNIRITTDEGLEILHQDIQRVAKDSSLEEVIYFIVSWAKENQIGIIAIGHRIVHGGSFYSEAVVMNDLVVASLQTLIPFSPLHQPFNLHGYLICKKIYPDLFQVGAFDSAFHSTCNPIAQQYALPKSLTEKGIRRYGFHGLSYEYIASKLPIYLAEKAKGKIIVAHLGSGSTLCALQDRISYSTSIGLTSMGGLPMSTRCGDVDPYLGVYLMSEKGWSIEEVQALFYKQSGLLGVSGISSDMAELLKSSHPDAKQAVELFIHRVVQFSGSLAAELEGLDAYIFTGGIGENAWEVRERVCEHLAWFGLELDKEKNRKCQKTAQKISLDHSRVPIWVIPTDEEVVIAKHTLALYQKHPV